MDRLGLWTTLEADPLAGWLKPEATLLPDLAPSARLLWCGIGGSLNPAATVVQALGSEAQRCRWTVLAGPDSLAPALAPEDQLVFASKSGTTLELWTWISHLRATPGWGRWERPPLVITQPNGNPLATWARAEGFPVVPVPASVGGRYAAFTPIGTLPLAWMGRDVTAYLEGARHVVAEAGSRQGPWAAKVWRAVTQLLDGYHQGIRAWVLLPYASRLQHLSTWWVQLIAESLGKTLRNGTRMGLTPIPALGPHDQHAQLQRWMAGPRDVGIFMLTVGSHAQEDYLLPPPACPYPNLAQCKPSQVMEAEADGTQRALVEAGVPTLRWHLDGGLTEADLGALLMAWQLIVALTGHAMGLNPFDQPAVEAGKRWTESLLGLEHAEA